MLANLVLDQFDEHLALFGQKAVRYADVPSVIKCPDCGGWSHLLTHLDDERDSLEPEEVLAYRCEDCNDRWDVVWEDS